ncbi:GCN5-related N-acetyltransferase [Rippkaea orientalis PCC 8801]|uniref:GCN5-related N-acetyltransferase n=1 Tax=Rippkaea orientalis (strain PCC 8801 / RF-1) TaxID=41431 RepID=B7JXL6_RIPO1|nr:GNAT family N-acetyltransferase [Rippkaea orientalis]ACK64773.1 GCN5-related N-acetyltransferase [Rippkaea orientalis PCC 8801]
MINIIKIDGSDDIRPCLAIRHEVFVLGQNVPLALEVDGLDNQSVHFLLYFDHNPIGTARLRFVNQGQDAKIERVAILSNYRSQGLGKQLMQFILDDLRENDTIKSVVLGAQIQVISFYQSLGFTVYGEVFLEAGIEHQMMRLMLKNAEF